MDIKLSERKAYHIYYSDLEDFIKETFKLESFKIKESFMEEPYNKITKLQRMHIRVSGYEDSPWDHKFTLDNILKGEINDYEIPSVIKILYALKYIKHGTYTVLTEFDEIEE